MDTALRILACGLLCVAAPRAQAPASRPAGPARDLFRPVQEALLAGELEAAGSLLAALPRPDEAGKRGFLAAAALLEAASAPWSKRPDAFLRVAKAFPDREEGATALAACLDHVLRRHRVLIEGDPDRGPLEPRHYLEQLYSLERKGRFRPGDLGWASRLFRDCLPLCRAWEARRPELPQVRLLSRLLAACRSAPGLLGPLYPHAPLRLEWSPCLDLPEFLAETIRFRLHPLAGAEELAGFAARWDKDPWEVLKPFLRADTRLCVFERSKGPGRSGLSIPAPPPGFYLLDLEAERDGWRVLAPFALSDLELIGCSGKSGSVLLAVLGGRPAPGVALLDARGGRRLATTDERGVARIPAPEGGRGGLLAGIAPPTAGASGSHMTVCRIVGEERAAMAPGARPELAGHLFLDRPLYRPGEIVRGRVLLRQHRPERPLEGLFGGAPDAAPVTRALGGRSVVLEFHLPGAARKDLELRTDDLGVACFSLPLAANARPGSFSCRARIPAAEGEFAETVGEEKAGWYVLLPSWERVAEIQEFRRPPVLWEVAWPAEAPPGAQPEIGIQARFASGAPAAGLEGSVRASLSGGEYPWNRIRLEQEVPFRLDAAGQARAVLEAPLRAHDCEPVVVACRVRLRAPDGQMLEEAGELRIAPAAPRPERRPGGGFCLSLPSDPAPAGSAVPVQLVGPPGVPALLVAGRSDLLWAEPVVLDGEGRAEVLVPTQASWFPWVELAAIAPKESCFFLNWPWCRPGDPWPGASPTADRARLALADPDPPIRIRLENLEPSYGPGGRAAWTVVVEEQGGRPEQAAVALSVLDERVARLGSRCHPDPAPALHPRWPGRVPCFERSLAMHDPPEEGSDGPFSLFFREGFLGRWSGVLAGPASSAASGPSGPEAPLLPRTEFRSTAFFAGDLRTGADGRARLEFAFPDDLTTWRVAAVAVDQGRRSATLRAGVETRRDPALTPLLPRCLRQGDRLRVETLAHALAGPLPAGSRLACTADGGFLAVEGGSALALVPEPPAAALAATAVLLGMAPGPGLFRARLEDPRAALLDQLDLALPVLDRNTMQRVWTVRMGRGRLDLEVPSLAGAVPGRVTLGVGLGVAHALAEAKAFLAGYPYGCAEQVASRLTPLALALHPRLDGGPRGLGPVEAGRLEAGLARLEGYKRRGGGFSWWGSGPADPQISAAVYRFLFLLGEAGVDPGDYGLDPEEHRRYLAEACRAARSGPAGPADSGTWELAGELAACGLLLFPEDPEALAACRALASRAAELPPGLQARCGQALALAGERAAAREIVGLIPARPGEELPAERPGVLAESREAVLAARLELLLAVEPGDPRRSEVAGLLLRCNRGGRFRDTLSSAASLVALARHQAADGPGAPPGPVTVAVEAPGFSRELRLGGDAGERAECVCPPGIRGLTLTFPREVELLASLAAELAEDGGQALPLARPFAVDRKLYRLLPGPDGTLSRREQAGAVSVGEPLEVEVAAVAPPEARYLVLDCPLPAGCEVIAAGEDTVVRDDRVVRCFPRGGFGPWRFRMTAGMAGRAAWPPARVEAMYDPELWGRSAGSWLMVEPARPARTGPAALFSPEFLRKRILGLAAALSEAEGCSEARRELEFLQRCLDREWFLQQLPVTGRHLAELLARPGLDRAAALEAWARWLVGEGVLPRPEEGQPAPEEAELHRLAALFADMDSDRHSPRTRLRLLRTVHAEAPRTAWVEEVAWALSSIEKEALAPPLLAEAADLFLRAWDLPGIAHRRSLLYETWALRRRKGAEGFRALVGLRAGEEFRRFLEGSAEQVRGWKDDGYDEHLLEAALESLGKKERREFLSDLVQRILGFRESGNEARFLEAAVRLLDALPYRPDPADKALLEPLGAPLFHAALRAGPVQRAEALSQAWELLPARARSGIPGSLLLEIVLRGGEEWAFEELLERDRPGLELARNAVRTLDDADLRERLWKRIPAAERLRLPLADFLDLAPRPGLPSRERGRLVGLLVRGPWSTPELGRRIAEDRDPENRMLLLQALAERKGVEIPWKADDPAASRYRLLLAARQGDPAAREEARANLEKREKWIDHDEESLELLWGLLPWIDLLELERYQTSGIEIPEEWIRSVLARTSPERIVGHLGRTDKEGEPLLATAALLSREQCRRLAPCVLDRLASGGRLAQWSQGLLCELLAQGRAGRRLAGLGPTLDARLALELLDRMRELLDFDLDLLDALAGHPRERIRKQSKALRDALAWRPAEWLLEELPPEELRAFERRFERELLERGPAGLQQALAGPDARLRQAAEAYLIRRGCWLGREE